MLNLHFQCPSAPSRPGGPSHNCVGPAGAGKKNQPPRWTAAALRNFSSSTVEIKNKLLEVQIILIVRSKVEAKGLPGVIPADVWRQLALTDQITRFLALIDSINITVVVVAAAALCSIIPVLHQ